MSESDRFAPKGCSFESYRGRQIRKNWMNAHSGLGCAALALLFVVSASACSLIDSGLDLPSTTSFHYVITTEWTFEGESETQRIEGYFMRDTSRVVYEPGEPYDEVIIIGQDAWARDSSGWFRQDRDFLATFAFPFGESLKEMTEMSPTEDLEDIGSGPVVDGERTRRYQINTGDWDFSDEDLDERRRSSPWCEQFLGFFEEFFSEGTGTALIGAETQRVYEMAFETEYEYSGAAGRSRLQVMLDKYGQPFTIGPPPGADELSERPAPNLPDWGCF